MTVDYLLPAHNCSDCACGFIFSPPTRSTDRQTYSTFVVPPFPRPAAAVQGPTHRRCPAAPASQKEGYRKKSTFRAILRHKTLGLRPRLRLQSPGEGAGGGACCKFLSVPSLTQVVPPVGFYTTFWGGR